MRREMRALATREQVQLQLRVTWWDRLLIGLAPQWGLRRIHARATAQMLSRHYEAAQGSRRTSGWQKHATDANAANGPALTALRELARDLRRNNGWARRGVQTIVNNTVGWGIQPKAGKRAGEGGKQALDLWSSWADTTSCDFDGRLNFYGLQRLAMETIVESGEVLILQQPASTADGLSIPMRLQVLEPDYLDTNRNGIAGEGGGPIIDGIEFDSQGRRVAYWLFTSHPGSRRLATTRFESQRVDAARVLHVYRVERPGQVRGVSWLASAIAKIKDLDDFEDAELMQQKVAACFGAFVTDLDGAGTALGAESIDSDGQPLEHLEPGHIEYLPPGKSVTFAQPPSVQDGAFTARTLRRIAASLGVTYEDLTCDYSQVNFSSARIARLAHWQNVHSWRWDMLIPQLCDGVWRWAMRMAGELGDAPAAPAAQWAAPPMPILEPDKEGLAYQRLIRIGAMTWPQMVRELGEDPDAQLDEIEATNKEFDSRGVRLDCDPRTMTSTGQQQAAPGAPMSGGAKTTPPPGEGGAPSDDGEGQDPPEETGADQDGAAAAPDEQEQEQEQENMKPGLQTKAATAAPAPKAEVKVFAYHQPFMKVREIREGIGLPGDVEDGDLFAQEFLAKHGGAAEGDASPSADTGDKSSS